MIQFDEHIFQMGWFNQQLVLVFRMIYGSQGFPIPNKKVGKPFGQLGWLFFDFFLEANQA